jgi:hypothetical protein
MLSMAKRRSNIKPKPRGTLKQMKDYKEQLKTWKKILLFNPK